MVCVRLRRGTWFGFDPFSEAEREIETSFFAPPWRKLWMPFAAAWRSPVMDVFETKNEVVVTAELPGVKKEDIKLRVTDEGINIKVKEREEKKDEKKGDGFYAYSYSSRFEGLSQSASFPCKVEASRAQATFKNGVLEVRIPKKGGAESEGREVKID
ncbi:MAG: Hsp20/alpha crystallin family protein [Candidatus Norongarragalinales archaeon]